MEDDANKDRKKRGLIFLNFCDILSEQPLKGLRENLTFGNPGKT